MIARSLWIFVVNGVNRASRFLLGTRAPSFRPREYPVDSSPYRNIEFP